MIRNQKWSNVRWVGLVVGAGALALLASATIPTSVPDRIAINEAAAIDALRSIVAAQVEFKAAVDIDTNCDGVGEYGYFAELGGTRPMRFGCNPWEGCACVPQAGNPSYDILAPGLLRRSLGRIDHRCVSQHGYLFQMWLPEYEVLGHVTAVREDLYGGKLAAPFPDPVMGAQMWCCYAWPISYGETGDRAFFVNQRGEVLEYSNRCASPLSGRSDGAVRPWFDEAYSVPGDMGSPPRIGIPNANGSVWWPVP
jgi:hypothetical protein